jgi:hypothetical protein
VLTGIDIYCLASLTILRLSDVSNDRVSLGRHQYRHYSCATYELQTYTAPQRERAGGVMASVY